MKTAVTTFVVDTSCLSHERVYAEVSERTNAMLHELETALRVEIVSVQVTKLTTDQRHSGLLVMITHRANTGVSVGSTRNSLPHGRSKVVVNAVDR